MNHFAHQNERIIVWMEEGPMAKNADLLQSALLVFQPEEQNIEAVKNEIGEILFSICVQARLQNINAEECLMRTVDKMIVKQPTHPPQDEGQGEPRGEAVGE